MDEKMNFDDLSPAMKRILSIAKESYVAVNGEFTDVIPSFELILQYAFTLARGIKTLNMWDQFFQNVENYKGITYDILNFENYEERIIQRTKCIYKNISDSMDEIYKKNRENLIDFAIRPCVKTYSSIVLAFVTSQELLKNTLSGWDTVQNEIKGLMYFVSSLNFIICALVCCKLCENMADIWKIEEDNKICKYVNDHYEEYGWYNLINMAKNTFDDCCFECGNTTKHVLINYSVFALIIYFYKYPELAE